MSAAKLVGRFVASNRRYARNPRDTMLERQRPGLEPRSAATTPTVHQREAQPMSTTKQNATVPSARNDYRGSPSAFLHHHPCDVRDVPGLSGVRVCACGRVWSNGKTRGAAFREVAQRTGRRVKYLTVQLNQNGLRCRRHVHTLVLLAFRGAPSLGDVGRHLDGNSRNNCAANLVWGTHKENADDRERHGRTARGTRNSQARHTDDEVEAALVMLAAGHGQREVARVLGCSQAAVWRWKHGQRRAG